MQDNEIRLTQIEKKLDMLCILGIGVNFSWLSKLENRESIYPVHLEFSDDKTVLFVNVDKSKLSGTAETLVRSRATTVNRPHYFSVRETIDNSKQSDMIFQLRQIKSVIATGTYISGKQLVIPFRFHHSVLGRINEQLRKISDSDITAQVVYLGSSPGLSYLLNLINGSMPLVAVSYYLPENAFKAMASRIPEPKTPFVSEIERTGASEENFKVLIYAQSQTNLPVETVSEKDGIYEMEMASESSEINLLPEQEDSLFNSALLFSFTGKRAEVTFFVPASEALSRLRKIYAATREKFGQPPVLTLFSPIGKELFEWL